MEVRFINPNNSYQQSASKTGRYNSCLSPLRYDTVSFGALKKTQFDGLDYAAVEKFKAPIEKFNSNEDLQKWCKDKVKSDILEKDFGGRQEETKIQRKAMLKEWTDYVIKDNDAYNNATALIILSAVTKGLRPDNDKLPPVLNKGILADCMSEIDTNLKKDKKYAFDLNKMYQNKLQSFYLEDFDTGEKGSKWVVIPSKKHDPENFAQNVDKLKTLSHSTWCTKSYNAEPALSEGDFHVYLEDGKPKVGIRFIGNQIIEIQDELNSYLIPYDYFDITKDYIKANNFKLSYYAERELKESEEFRKNIEKMKLDLNDTIDTNTTTKIFDYLGFKSKIEDDGSITLSEYTTLGNDGNIFLKYLGINENKLFEQVKRIDGDAIFTSDVLFSLGGLEHVGGNLVLCSPNVKSLGNLKYIGGILSHNYQSDILDSNLEFVNGINIKELAKTCKETPDDVEKIFNLCGIKTQKDKDGLLTISAYHDPVEYLITFENLGINQDKLLEKVKRIDGNTTFKGCSLTSLGSLESIGGYANFSASDLASLGKLKTIEGSASFLNSNLTSLDNLETIGGDAFFNSDITSLGKLKTIGGDAHFRNSKLTSLDNLETIGGDAYFDRSQITNLGKLKYVGGVIYRKNSNLQYSDIKNLERGHNKLYYL